MQAVRKIQKPINGQLLIQLPENFHDVELEIIIFPVMESSPSLPNRKKKTSDYNTKEDFSTPLDNFEDYTPGWKDIERETLLAQVAKPVQETLDVEALKQAQNWHGTDRKGLMQLIDDMDIQEPIENLLAQLNA